LLVIAMPVTIVALAMAGLVAAGLTLAAAILLGGAMAPTDPVLAGGVQVGGPMQGKEEPVRFALTTEAGLNDGLAFPFIHLGILVALSSGISGDLLLTWAGKYVLYKIVAGALGGAATGWLVSRFLFLWPRRNPLSRTEAGVVAIAAVLFAYGVTELVQGYGFIAAFVAGLVVRRTEHRHEFNNTLHSFTETMEQSLTAFVLLALGAAIPVLWPWLDWRAMTLAALLVLVIRPGAGLLAMAGSRFTRRQRLVMSFYGIRGVGSIYYLAYAAGKAEFDDVGVLWATMTAAIIFSTVVHGLTATYAVESVEENPMPEKPPQPTVP
jgi:NhaP-type Na+/H+ or K+/H+ antiporter